MAYCSFAERDEEKMWGQKEMNEAEGEKEAHHAQRLT